MLRRIVVTALLAACATAFPAVAVADPPAPQPDASCPSQAADALTFLADEQTAMVCGDDGQWRLLGTPYPNSDRWLSYGPALKLHGEGLRNSMIASGDWTATPLSSDARCRAVQKAVVLGTPNVGPPSTTEGEPGQPLSLQVVPKLFSIELSGDCLWQRVTPSGS